MKISFLATMLLILCASLSGVATATELIAFDEAPAYLSGSQPALLNAPSVLEVAETGFSNPVIAVELTAYDGSGYVQVPYATGYNPLSTNDRMIVPASQSELGTPTQYGTQVSL